ncbi:MAG: hypothetical protein L0Y45_00250 [Woeseiaceae bacterium]|nr:hypothetical protein [Woeseiaceae bacterium]
MQKIAAVRSPRSTALWRLASDEGPYLKGFDSAPCPLAFFTTGMVASIMCEAKRIARQRDIDLHSIVLQLDNFYSMQGSATDGTMRGGARAPRLEAWLHSAAGDQLLAEMLHDAVQASPVCALVRKPLHSLFTLTLNGQRIATDREPAAARGGPRADSNPVDLVPVASEASEPPRVRKLTPIDTRLGVAGGYGTSLAPNQDRQLHIRGSCRLLPDGRKEIHQELFSPLGSSFCFVSDEAAGFGGGGAAPDAASYAAAGIAFCFMTQIGRYARISRREPDAYSIVQDVHFSGSGESAADRSEPGDCDAVETHLHIQGSLDAEFARKLLDMGEQTCFLHALCRSALDIDIVWQRAAAGEAPFAS